MSLPPSYANGPDIPQCDYYSYTSLPGREWIRTVTVSPGDGSEDGGPLTCTIYTQQLDLDYGLFWALSYSWAMPNGDDCKSRSIIVDRSRMRVTQNLFEALIRLRHFHGTFTIWVDAICINQEDVEERNEQVSQMSRIYQRADEVIAWLGAEENLRAWSILQCFAADLWDCCSSKHTFRTSDGNLIDLCRRRRSKSSDLTRDDHLLRPYGKELIRCVKDVLQRRYFERLWVLPEMYHARDLRFVWGSSQLSLMSLTSGASRLQRMVGDRVGLMTALWYPEFSIPNYRRGPVALYYVVRGAVGLKCSDPRDIVFALISLSDERCGIRPDYSLSYSDVCISFSKYLVESGQLGMLLEMLPGDIPLHLRGTPTVSTTASTQREAINIPTWVLDLRTDLKEANISRDHLVAMVNSDNSLSCHIHRIGVVRKVQVDVQCLWLGSCKTPGRRPHRRQIPKAKVVGPNAVLAQAGDLLVAFEHSGAECSNVLLLRRSGEGSYRLLDWVKKVRLESQSKRRILRPSQRKTTVRIV